MEKETRRLRKQQAPAATRPRTTTVHDLPDHLLNDIIVHRLRCHVSAIRAAAVCARWRRIASTLGKGNPEWYRHEFSTCLGHYYRDVAPSPSRRRRHAACGFVPASSDHPAVAASYFSLDFLPRGPGGRPWELVEGCGSLLLLAVRHRGGFFPDLVVCEPITRCHVRIRPIPEMRYSRCLGAFLGYRNNFGAMSRFTVTCVLADHAAGMEAGASAVTARVYRHDAPPNAPSSVKNGWVDTPAPREEEAAAEAIHLRGAESARYAGRAWGSLFWGVEDDGSVFSFNKYGPKVSHFRLPEHVRESHRQSTFRFVEDAHEYSMARLVSLFGDELRVFAKRHHNDGSTEWRLEKSLRLPEATRALPGHKECFFGTTAKIVTASKGYVVLTPAEETWLFSVEIRTMQVERDHIRNRFGGEVYPYELEMRPKVNASVVPCKRGRRKPCWDYCKCS